MKFVAKCKKLDLCSLPAGFLFSIHSPHSACGPRTHTMVHVMTSSNGNTFRVTGLSCGEFTGHRWIPRTKASDAELWCFLWSGLWINGWVNNHEAGNLRRQRAHYDVIVMIHNVCAMGGTRGPYKHHGTVVPWSMHSQHWYIWSTQTPHGICGPCTQLWHIWSTHANIVTDTTLY